MNRIYQKFPIIAQNSGFLIWNKRKRAKHDIESNYINDTNNEILKMSIIRILFFLILSFLFNLHLQRVIIYLIFHLRSFKRYDFQTEFMRQESDDVSFLK